MTYNQELQNQRIQAIKQLITQAKANLKSWASQISKYHKTLKTLTNQLNSIKSQLTISQPKNQLNNSNK